MIGPVMLTRPLSEKQVASNAARVDGREAERLAALRSYNILDTQPEPGFDDLAQLAAAVCQAPMALIGFFDADRYWVKAQVGLKLDAVPRDYALYHVSDQPEFEEIPDTLSSRLADHPMVLLWPKVRFYAGTPIVSSGGQLLGVLMCWTRRRASSARHSAAAWR